VRPRTLTGGIALLLGIATAVLLGAAALLMDHLLDAQMRRRFDVDLLTRAQALAALVESGPQGLAMDSATDPPARLLAGDAQGGYLVQCANGKHLQSTPPPTAPPADWQRGGARPGFADTGDGARAQRATWFGFTLPGTGGARSTPPVACRLLFAQSRATLDELLLAIDLILTVIPLAAMLAVLALAPFLVRGGLRPLTRLRASMRDIGPQQPGQRLQPTGMRELEPLVASFNEVLARMDEVLARERRFTSALAHETRTRLAELRTLVEVERRYPSGRTMETLLGEVGAIGGEMEGTVSGLLLLTRLEAGLDRPDWQPIDLPATLARHAARVASMARQRAVRIETLSPSEPTALRGDAALLDIVLGNLLGNACEYAPTGSAVRIHLQAAGLSVDNAAPDLDASELACLGQRYWSKQQGRGGHTGLGLALAGAAATAMGWQLGFALDGSGRLRATLDWRGAPGRR
jgi:signal transduction histidine kinase